MRQQNPEPPLFLSVEYFLIGVKLFDDRRGVKSSWAALAEKFSASAIDDWKGIAKVSIRDADSLPPYRSADEIINHEWIKREI